MSHTQILIIGGGTAGIMVAAQLRRKNKSIDVTILEPSDKHIYQPAWTLVGAGAFDLKETYRDEAKYIPKGVHWIKDKAVAVDPDQNQVTTAQSGTITYDYLVIAPGLVMKPELIKGLKENLGKNNVCSVYTDPEHTWEVLQRMKKGNALFTQPSTPIKCGGAPQKIMYLSEHHFRKAGVRDDVNVIFATPGSVIFGVKEFAKTLNKILHDRDIIFKTFYKLVEINADTQTATFQYTQTDSANCTIIADDRIKEKVQGDTLIEMHYDMLHLAPPQAAPDFISQSTLAISDGPNAGWVGVDINTLQHMTYPNVFALGDVAALPTAKTGAAIRKQAPVVVGNLLHLIEYGKLDNKIYEGYSSCPLVTGYGSMVLAEFKYNNVRDSDPLISTFVDTTKEQYSMWLLKKYGLPYLYWNQMLRGKM
jgi:sulfide:quinone oxidoreductase